MTWRLEDEDDVKSRLTFVVVAIVLFGLAAVPAAGFLQASWGSNDQPDGNTCGMGYVPGNISFCRRGAAGTPLIKYTNDPDGYLRSSGVDRYSDGFLIGTPDGQTPNTRFAHNGFSSTNIYIWTYAGCTGPKILVTVGNSDYTYLRTSGLMSFASTSRTSC